MALLFPKRRNKMASTVERIGVVETKVENLNEKLDDLKIDVKDMHDCLDNTREGLTSKLDQMYEASCSQHEALAKEISYIKSQRDKLIWTFAGIVAAGGFFAGHADKILKILGG
jgi:flagellar capping protein FliD